MAAHYGYIGRMLFVNLSEGKTSTEELSEDLAQGFIGGYGIGLRVIYERLKTGVDPLGPENIFALGTGPLSLTGTVSTCRYTAMGKSPLTGYWSDANSDGNFAADGLNFRWIELMKAITGWDLNIENLKKTGQRIGTMLHLFNFREGFKFSDFTIPERARGNPPLTAGPTKGVTLDIEELQQHYFEAMGFDFAAGKFRQERLEALSLQDIEDPKKGEQRNAD